MSVGEVFGIHAPFWQIFYRTAIVYLVIVVALRISGRRQLGQMTPFDLVLVLLIANAVQNAMVGPDNSILGGLLAAGTLIAMNQVVLRASRRIRPLDRIFEGTPVVLVDNGELVEPAIRAEGLTDELVLQAMREHGFEDIREVRHAVLEIDGTISIVPRSSHTVRTRHRVRAVRPGGS
ncbi:MAG TPA: YetF domain-containing protein [Dehalococcoidia bacterium]|jgi:uncharacterized membrane protein YcaP (DUF421 family)